MLSLLIFSIFIFFGSCDFINNNNVNETFGYVNIINKTNKEYRIFLDGVHHEKSNIVVANGTRLCSFPTGNHTLYLDSSGCFWNITIRTKSFQQLTCE